MVSKNFGMPRALWLFTIVSAVLVCLSVLTAAFQAHYGYSGLGWSTLYLSYPGFDYFDYLPRFRYLHTATFFLVPGYPWYYPAPAIFVLYPFYKLPAHGYIAFVVTVLALSAGVLFVFGSRLRRESLSASAAVLFCAVLALSWPLYFGLQRGNIEAITWMVVAAGIWAYLSGRPVLAAILVGVAGSIKIYPLLFLCIFFRKREYRAIAVGLASCAVVTVLGLAFLDADVVYSAHRTAAGILQWTRDYAEVMHQAIDHSAFGLAKHFTYRHHPNYRHELHVYYIAAALLSVLAFVRVIRLPLLNLVLFVSCVMVTLPPASFDYTLVALYIPLAWLTVVALRAQRNGVHVKGLLTYFVLLAVVLSPETFLMQSVVVNLPGALKGTCLLALIGMSATYPLAADY